MKWNVRDVLLVIYGVAWFIVVIVVAVRRPDGDVPPQLWAVLGVGVGAIMAVFRTDERLGRSNEEEGNRNE